MSLPSGYKRLEYIQSTGTQYVDAGFKPTGSTKVVCDFQMLNQGSSQQGVFGSRPGTSGRFTVFTGQNGASDLQVDYNTEQTLASVGNSITGLNVNSRTTLEVSNSLVINGTTVKTVSAASFTSTYNLFLFANNNAGTAQLPGILKLYSCQIYDNGTLVRDFIPCKNTGGAVGLWDDVNSVFYGNAWTGTFTAGPEVGVSTPANFRLSSSSEATATLAWDAVDGATGYKLYRDGVLIATLTDTSYTDAIQPFAFYVYTLTAYNDDGESEAAALTYYAAPDNPILYLVTNRTAADVAVQNAKGTYKAEDLNRVGASMNYVADRLRAAGYDPHISPKTDWKDEDWVDPASQAVYLGDLAELRKQFAMMKSTPEVPPRILATGINTNDGLTHTWANNIEKILEDVDALITNIMAGWFYSGDLFSGEV